MDPNLYLAKNVIRVLRRGGGSGPGIDLHQRGIESVVFQLFLRGVILLYLGKFRRYLFLCVTSFLDTRAHKSTKLSLSLLNYIPDKSFFASGHI